MFIAFRHVFSVFRHGHVSLRSKERYPPFLSPHQTSRTQEIMAKELKLAELRGVGAFEAKRRYQSRELGRMFTA